MEENKENLRQKISIEGVKDTEVFSFGYLIDTILGYYAETSIEGLDSSESWKKGTEYEKNASSASINIPADVDKMVKKAFEKQLRKFSK